MPQWWPGPIRHSARCRWPPSCCGTATPIPATKRSIALCRERLARFKVPVAFIRLDAIPRTAAGKPRRAELRATLDPTPRIEQESPA